MPMHDWTRADDIDFHDFHNAWIIHLKEALNTGGLPPGYSATSEMHINDVVPDVVAVARAAAPARETNVAVAEPTAEFRMVGTRPAKSRQRRIAIRRGRRVVAGIEIVSRSNKDREEHVAIFARKVTNLLEQGIHVAVLDILPPGAHDPGGLHAAIWQQLDSEAEIDPAPEGRPLTFASYRAEDPYVAYANYGATGAAVPPLPLYLDGNLFIDLPTEATYTAAFAGMPAEVRTALG